MIGDGDRDVVVLPGFVTHLDLNWDLPWSLMLRHLAEGGLRVIVLDKRGTGLSDRSLGLGSLEDRARDITAVMGAVGSDRASVMGVSEGGPIALLYAAMYPERVERLVIMASLARALWAPDYECGFLPETSERMLAAIGETWGTGEVYGSMFMQRAADPAQATQALAKFERNACTPQLAVEIMRRNLEIDVRGVLPGISAPTLVVHQVGDPLVPVAMGRYIAEHVPGAQYYEGPGDFDGSWRPADYGPVRDVVAPFLLGRDGEGPAGAVVGVPAPATIERSVATVLFTDIVGSTERAADLGDQVWKTLLDQHDAAAAAAVEQQGGRLVKTTGDGLLATFEGPSRGIACARALQAAMVPIGVEVRAGVHTGEIERRGDDIGGIGVHIGARIAALAGPGEVWVSRTVKDLTAGSSLTFEERGRHVLKGVPDEWELFAQVPWPAERQAVRSWSNSVPPSPTAGLGQPGGDHFLPPRIMATRSSSAASSVVSHVLSRGS